MLGHIEFFGHVVSITATFVVVVLAFLQRTGYVNTYEIQNNSHEAFESRQESYRHSLMFSLAITIPIITKLLIEINLHLSSFKGMSTTRQMSLNFWLTFVNGFLRYIPLQIIFVPVVVLIALPRMSGPINFGIHIAQLSALSYYFSFALIDRRNREEGPIFTSVPVSFLAMSCTVTMMLLFLSTTILRSSTISACYWTMFFATSILIIHYLRLSIIRSTSMNVVSDAAITQSRTQNKENSMNQFIGMTSREEELHTMTLLAILYFCTNVVVIGFSSVSSQLIMAVNTFLVQKQVDSALVLVASVITMLWILLGDRKLRHEVVNMQAAKRLNRGFVRFISHELRSPLNHQVLGLQMLYDDLSNDDRMSSKLKEIAELQDTCEASLQILNDILVFDELSNGTTGDNSNNISGSSSRPKILMVDVFLNDTVKRFRNRNQGDGVKFNVDIDLSAGNYAILNTSPSMSSLNNLGANIRMDNKSNGQSNASHSTGKNKPLLLVDRVELKCVLRSLIRNAERASPVNGTVTIKSYLISHNTPSNGMPSQASSFSEYIPIIGLSRPIQSSNGSSKDSKPNSPIGSSSDKSRGTEQNRVGASSNSTIRHVYSWLGPFLSQNSQTSSRESFHPTASVVPSSPPESQAQSAASISGVAMTNVSNSSSSANMFKTSSMFRGLFGSTDENDRGKQFGLTEAGILRIEISDQGSGMSLDDQKKLLKRSMALAPEDLQCGQAAGLRITIARAILERYGGLLTVESQGINRGCTFIAHIPYYYRKKGMIQQTFGNSTITQAIQHALTIVNGNFNSQSGTLDMKALELDRHSSSASHCSPSWKSGSAHHDESRSNSMRSSNSTTFGNLVHSTKSSMEVPNPRISEGGSNNNNINGLRNRILSRISMGSNHSSRGGDGTGSKENSVHSRNSTTSSCPAPLSTNNNNNISTTTAAASASTSCTVAPSEWSPSASSVTKVTPMNTITRSALESRRLNILIVDDVVSSRKILKRMLFEMGHNVDEAVDGIDAIRMVELAKKDCHPFDAIFMDCMMPRMDGPTATRQILALGYTGIIIGFTGITSYDSNRFLSYGASKILEKPLKREAVALVMHEISQRVQRRIAELESTQRTVLSDGEENEGDTFNEDTSSAFIARTRSRDEESSGHEPIHHGKHQHHHNNRHNHKESESTNNLEAGNSQQSRTEQDHPNNDKSLHFLVVDDVPSNRKMVSRLLTRRGFTVDEACDGLDAYLRVAKSIRKQQLESERFSVNFEVESTNSNGNNHNANNKVIPVLDPIQKIMTEFRVLDSNLTEDTVEANSIRPFDGIIMDFVMPNLDGPSACKRLREELKYRRPIIGVTGNVLSADIEIFMAQGANRVIGKPLKLELFDEILKDLYPELLASRTYTS